MINQLFFVLFLVIVVWLGILSYYLYKTVAHYKKLVTGTRKETLAEILSSVMTQLEERKKDSGSLRKDLDQLISEGVQHIQKVGILRFNPFDNVGGEQSFILVVLDGNNSGIVLSSLHSRGQDRWYAKNVKEGKGVDHELSEEEKKAIKNAFVLKKTIKS